MQLLESESAALAELKKHLKLVFGSRLRELRLFGSRARGQGDEDSDIDVLVVVDDLVGNEARKVAYFAGDLLTRYDVLVSPFAVSTKHMDDLRSRERLIAQEIDREGVPL
ncbi:MAG: nucleotidyltransferase domain-containing protein [Myxococcota bacterium]